MIIWQECRERLTAASVITGMMQVSRFKETEVQTCVSGSSPHEELWEVSTERLDTWKKQDYYVNKWFQISHLKIFVRTVRTSQLLTAHISVLILQFHTWPFRSSSHSNNSKKDEYSAEAWNSGWEIEETSEERQQEAGRQKFEDQPWLQECITSLSPTVDVLALAYRQYAVILTSKWDVNEESSTKLKFGTSFEGRLPGCSRDENITSLLCLPLASQKRSMQGGPDWTCITVGFSSGYVRIYTEKGELLLSQLLHEEPVGHLRCKTHVPQHYANYSEQPEELVILYSTVVVTIDGFGLFQTLRACRNQLARLTAGRQESAQPPPLSYKKWGFQEHDKLMDCEAAGSLTISAFDHLVTESIRKGFYGSAKASVPSNSLLITTGSNPYAGFYYATEGSSQLFLSDIVHAAANKLINFLTHSNPGGLLGFIGRGEQEEQKNKPKIEPATLLPLRFGLYDKRRQGISITLSPNKSLATITDAFGRIIMFDVQRGIAVRIWKGYRDAQCGWVEVEDTVHAKDSFSSSTSKRKHAFFLVIYAPRRGILEVWCAQQGPRAAAFNVGRSGRLLFPGYTMVGANYAASGLSRRHLSACYFLDPDGTLRKIVVPFHAILSERNSKRARDLHLLKELRITLKNKAEDKSEEIVKILKDMRTSSVRIQALDSIFNSRRATVDMVGEVTSALLEHLLKQDPEKTDHEMKLLKQGCIRAQQLVKLYCAVDEINNNAGPKSSTALSVDIQLYSTSLCISETEIGRILSLVTLHQSLVPVSKKHVRFQDDVVTDMHFCDFMSCFTVNDSHLVKSGEEIVVKNLPVMLTSGISEKQIESLGGFLFHTCINVGSSLSSLHTALKNSGIHPNKLLLLLLHHWVSDIGFCSDAEKWLNLQQVMKHISSLTDPKIVSSDSDRISPWWEAVREILVQSNSNLAAYVGAVVARSVSVVMAASFNVEQKCATGSDTNESGDKNSDEKAESGDSDWEAVSLDLEHWNLLLKQLEDMLLLSMLLKSQPYGKTATKDINLSVSTVINGGPGMITDLVAVWAVSAGFDPGVFSKFVVDGGSENNSASDLQSSDSDSSSQQAVGFVKGLILEVKKRFPCSLNHDALLANCCWENTMLWNKNKDGIHHLNQALSCLHLVNSSAVKNGFASMIWKGCVQKRFEALSLLMEKVGKTPKERLCRKELEMSDNCLESFLDFCCQVLTIISETSRAVEVEDVPKFACEYLWQDRENVGPTPLIIMALGQRVSANHLVYQHLQLSVVLQMIVTFQLKSVKPLSLFSDNAKKNFFRDLHYKSSLPDDKDSGLQSLRTQFLMKVVAAIAQGAPENVPDPTVVSKSLSSSEATPSESCVKPQGTTSLAGQRLASKWFGRVLELSHEWGLNMDELRRHYVCELYSGGQDYLAQEIMPSVSNCSFLGSQLLLLAGQRVHNAIYNNPDPASRLACLPPDLSKWLKSLDDVTLRCNSVPLDATASLIDHILVFFDDGQREKALAQSLRDAISRLLLISEPAHS